MDFDSAFAAIWLQLCAASTDIVWLELLEPEKAYSEEEGPFEVLETAGYIVTHEVQDRIFIKALYDDEDAKIIYCSCAGSTLVWENEKAED